MVIYFKSAREKLKLLTSSVIFPKLNSTLHDLIFFQSFAQSVAILSRINEMFELAIMLQVHPIDLFISHRFVFFLKNSCKKRMAIAVSISVVFLKFTYKVFLLLENIIFHISYYP